jgi:hypothetical protein
MTPRTQGDSGHEGWGRRHVARGWWALLFFLSLGIVLEAMHGLKVGYYLDASSETRRLMWTLAHAHGVLLALTHVVFGVTIHVFGAETRGVAMASRCLSAATILLPGGFLLGGFAIHGGDPGLGVLLVPPGAALLFAAVLLTARAVTASPERAG